MASEYFDDFILIVHVQLFLMEPSGMFLLKLDALQQLHRILCSFKQHFHPVRAEYVLTVTNNKVLFFEVDPIGNNTSAQIHHFQ